MYTVVVKFVPQAAVGRTKKKTQSLGCIKPAGYNQNWSRVSEHRAHHFESREEILLNMMVEMNTILNQVYQKCFQQWKGDHWAKCVEAQGAYFEGDWGLNLVT